MEDSNVYFLFKALPNCKIVKVRWHFQIDCKHWLSPKRSHEINLSFEIWRWVSSILLQGATKQITSFFFLFLLIYVISWARFLRYFWFAYSILKFSLKQKVVFTLILSINDRTDPLEKFPITFQNFYWISFWNALKP